jgi:hypothetical protein
VAGKRLDHFTMADLRRKWDRPAEAAEKGEPQGTATLAFSCGMLRGFVQECPAWDPNAASLALRACSADLDTKLAAAERELDLYVAGTDVAGTTTVRARTRSSGSPPPSGTGLPGPLWPDNNSIDPGVGTAAARVRELSPSDPKLQRFEALRAEVAALQDAETKLRDAGTSCAGLDQLANFAKQAGGRVATYLDRVGQEARRAQIAKIEAGFSESEKKAPNMMSADLAELTAEVAAVKAGASELACLEPSTGAQVLALADTWTQFRTKEITEEQACRDSAPCMKNRLTLQLSLQLCDVLDGKRSAQAHLAELRRNGARFGVIDVVELKDSSDAIVMYEQEYKERAADFRKRTGKAFSPSVCKKLAN